MTREGSTRDGYTGRSGQLVVLAERLARHWNVAIPEVDHGDDVLTFVLDEPNVTRIQVSPRRPRCSSRRGSMRLG